MTGIRACLFWLSYSWWVNVILFVRLFWPTVADTKFTERLGQCRARLDSFALATDAHERGGDRSEW